MDSVIFDVDGTLWDSRREVADSWKLVCRSRAVPSSHITPERLKAEFGKPMAEIGRSLFPELGEMKRNELCRELCDFEVAYLKEHFPKVYEGVPELFAALARKQIPLFIVSNCQAGYIGVLLKSNELVPFVKDHLCPDDSGFDKAGNIKEIIRRHKLLSPVYVGDTMGDYGSAKKAGCAFIHAAYGFGEVPDAERKIESPLELLSFF
ncbi:MAG: HAD family hydrolase [Bacteroidales bacterium]|nr:HAD family hydrolase [Bacteroidales bacterium]